MPAANLNRRFLATVAAALLAVTPVLAQDAAPAPDTAEAADVTTAGVSETYVRAYDIAMARINQTLSHDEVAQLNLLAYAAAASGLCDGLELDEAAVYGALTAATHASADGADEKDAEIRKDFALIAFGILTGLILENGATDEASFCADADDYVDEAGTEAFLSRVDASEGGG